MFHLTCGAMWSNSFTFIHFLLVTSCVTLHVRYAKSANINLHSSYVESVSTSNKTSTDEIDWNLYELNKQQVMEYDDIDKQKGSMIKQVNQHENNKELEDKMDDLIPHGTLKQEAISGSFIIEAARKPSSRKKRSGNTGRFRNRAITVHGGWSPWSTVYTPCNATCGGGKTVRRRSCSYPKPQVNNKFTIRGCTTLIII